SSPIPQFEDRRFDSHGSFVYWRGELSRTNKLPLDLQLYARAQGQYSGDLLLSADQFSAGGADSVRGYYESEAVGDFGVSGQLELRGPSLSRWLGRFINDWRFHIFLHRAWLGVHQPLPQQDFRLPPLRTWAGPPA